MLASSGTSSDICNPVRSSLDTIKEYQYVRIVPAYVPCPKEAEPPVRPAPPSTNVLELPTSTNVLVWPCVSVHRNNLQSLLDMAKITSFIADPKFSEPKETLGLCISTK